MIDLTFEVVGARAEPHAAVPTLMFRLRVTEADARPVHAAALRSQIRIEPQRRKYQAAEEDRLSELFGATPRWGDTMRPFLWTHVATMLPSFSGQIEVDLPVECSYDFEVAAAKYLHALDGGEIPLIFLFSGTVFARGENGFSVEQVGWDRESPFRLPVETWRQVMDLYFPNSSWLRVRRDTMDRLQRFKVGRAVPTWDQAFAELLKLAGEDDE